MDPRAGAQPPPRSDSRAGAQPPPRSDSRAGARAPAAFRFLGRGTLRSPAPAETSRAGGAAFPPPSPGPALNTPPRWLDEDAPATLARRVAHVTDVLERHAGAACAGCNRAVCGHQVLFSLAAGHEEDPLCLPCLAEDVGRAPQETRDALLRYVHSKDCLRTGWKACDAREGTPEGALPACVSAGSAAKAAAAPVAAPREVPDGPVAASWDAGDLGCGELVLELRMRLQRLPPGAVLHLRATDPGAPEDLPAWCRLTGNALLHAAHPDYRIRRKD